MNKLLFILAFLPSLVIAQEGSIHGRIVDENGKAIELCTVYLSNDHHTLSDAQGFFQLEGVAYGD